MSETGTKAASETWAYDRLGRPRAREKERPCRFCQNHWAGEMLNTVRSWWELQKDDCPDFEFVGPIFYCPLCGKRLEDHIEMEGV